MRRNRAAAFPFGDHVLRKLGTFVHLDDTHLAELDRLLSETMAIDSLHDIVTEGESCKHLFLLTRGWAVRYKLLSDGRRQILGFVIPGDFFGLRASLFDVADDTVQSLTDCTVCRIPGEDFVAVLRDHPRLGMAIVWSIVREYSVLAEHVVSLGRRSALERTAHLLMELLNRLQLVHLAGEKDFELPLTQEILADALGLSIVHCQPDAATASPAGTDPARPPDALDHHRQARRSCRDRRFQPPLSGSSTPPADSLLKAIRSQR